MVADSLLLASSPGEIYISTVAQVPRELVGGQVTSEGTFNPFATVSEANGLYPVRVHFPADGNPINALAKILLWISAWMAYIF